MNSVTSPSNKFIEIVENISFKFEGLPLQGTIGRFNNSSKDPISIKLDTPAVNSSYANNIGISGSASFTPSSSTNSTTSNSEERNLPGYEYFKCCLLNLLEGDSFETGNITRAETYLLSELYQSPIIVREWINKVFAESFNNIGIIVGLLHSISHIEYTDIYPTGQTMALAGLSHKNIEVREYSIKCFENWGRNESLIFLKNLHFSEKWLQKYVESVIKDIE